MTVTELQASIDSLKRAKYSGVKRVQYTDSAVEYNSFAEVNRALQLGRGISETTVANGEDVDAAPVAKIRDGEEPRLSL